MKQQSKAKAESCNLKIGTENAVPGQVISDQICHKIKQKAGFLVILTYYLQNEFT